MEEFLRRFSKKRMPCSPKCMGYDIFESNYSCHLPEGFVEIQRCDECNGVYPYRDDVDSALRIGGPTAIWADSDGHRGRLVTSEVNPDPTVEVVIGAPESLAKWYLGHPVTLGEFLKMLSILWNALVPQKERPGR